jgi:hypothetical protein
MQRELQAEVSKRRADLVAEATQQQDDCFAESELSFGSTTHPLLEECVKREELHQQRLAAAAREEQERRNAARLLSLAQERRQQERRQLFTNFAEVINTPF